MGALGFRSTAVEALQGRDLSGLQVIITGGNSGLGAHTALVLASAGAHVVLTSRSLQAGEAVAKDIDENTSGKGKVAVRQLDLADLQSIRQFAEGVSTELPQLDVLILNAGVMALPTRRETKDGFELQIGTNHIGHHYLTQLLLPKLKQSPAARVVVLSSVGHNYHGLDIEDLNWERRFYGPWKAYGASKLANALFAMELAQRMHEEGAPVKAYAVHPGVIATGLSRHMLGGFWFGFWASVTTWIPWLGGKTVEQGAATTVYAATSPEVEAYSGAYLADCAVKAPSRAAQDAELARRLWDKTEELISAALERKAGTGARQ